QIRITDNTGLLIAAGLLVGFGTYVSNGCTSGHGVCGMGRLSVRSLVATITFMAAGIVTVAVMNAMGVSL
ncbi:MAG: YeeE/YedE thiosulfate transporter family protein, partial [Thalassolituus sp.]